MESTKVKNLANNQLEITTDKGRFFQSYDTVIAFLPADGGAAQLDSKKWDYSKTTAKYRNEFLGETTKSTLQKIKSGEIVLTDLNAKK